ANKIEVMYGTASFLDEGRIGVESGHQFDMFRFKHAIVASGARPVPVEGQINSLQLFNLEEVPASLVLSGFTSFTLEAAFAYSALGSDVSIVSDGSQQLELDEDIQKEVSRLLKKRKIKHYPGITHLDWSEGDEMAECTFVNARGEEMRLECSHFYSGEKWEGGTTELGVKRIGVLLDEDRFILTDKEGRTEVPAIFAAGDVTGFPFLAVKGIRQGKTAAEAACGIPGETDLTWIPTVIHSDPPLAFAGFTEKEAIEAGYSVKTGLFPLAANGFAALTGSKEGLMKVVLEEETDRLLGAHLLGEGAIELISGAVLGLEMGARDEDFLFPFYPHPGLGEAFLEAVEQTKGLAIHQPPAKKAKQKEGIPKA
ncbi:MAG TPA: FAD-dependent oxidoreductase, partial [Bacillaceae bacterium]